MDNKRNKFEAEITLDENGKITTCALYPRTLAPFVPTFVFSIIIKNIYVRVVVVHMYYDKK